MFKNVFCLSFVIYIYPFLFNSTLAQTNNQEFRATWVITWEHISSSKTAEQNKATIREILDNHVKANMTSVLFQVRQSGTAYYQSSFEPWGYYAGYTYPGYDPLQYAVEEAHKRGLELHAWFNVFNVSSTYSGTISVEHPEWICRDQNGNPMTSYKSASPGLQAVRDYTISVAMEIVRNYDIDGLHLDYVRWNEYDTDDMLDAPSQLEQETKPDGLFSDKTISKLTSPKSTNRFLYDIEHPYSAGVPPGFSSWEDWWRWSVTEFVKTLHDSIQVVKPWVKLSPAALGKYKYGGSTGWNGYYVVYQDAALWFNEGYVEQLTPMHYHWLTGEELFNFLTLDWEPNIQQGIIAGRLYSCGPGSYRLDENNVWSNHVGIVERLRDKSWVDGYQFFSYGTWRNYDYWEEAGSTFFKSKVKLREVLTGNQVFVPSLSILKIDSLTYDLIVTPNASQNTNSWFALYRSEDDLLDINLDTIVAINFGNSLYTFRDSYSGLQNFNGSYKYFATSLNRFWNESQLSNSVTTDLIPSFAPTVVSSYPAQNATINTTDNIIIEFSKRMNVSSFTDKIHFTPNSQIIATNWDEVNIRLTILHEEFLFNTQYTLTIDSTVADVNGKMLDGNNDGIPGDPFELDFSISEEDLTGPQILYNYPSNNDTNVDVGSIITIVFDETVDNQSLTTNSVKLFEEGLQKNFSFQHSKTSDGRSVLCIQPSNLFQKNKSYTIFLAGTILDTLGNPIGTDWESSFSTSALAYQEIKMIDNFTNPGDWQQPGYSGSTTGILESGTHFEYSTQIYLPVTNPKKSAKLSYLWDENASTFLIREYLKGGIPQTTYFDTSYVLQSYVYGDGSNTKFRFCIDEFQGSAWGDHEVSNWVDIDWYGWKLVEWKLNDPASVGIWIGDEVLTGSYFRIDSYQLTKTFESLISGTIYFDDLRAVKKSSTVSNIELSNQTIPTDFKLFQNYPNPFNPSTVIMYQLPNAGNVLLKVYDVLGNEVVTLVNEYKSAGSYNVEFNSSTINHKVSSGVYFYTLQTGSFVETKKMILLR
jgi:uncharacterized lipoprotein YddW (UPF0748 family)